MAKAARSRLRNKDNRSDAILRRVSRLDEYEGATAIGFYVDVRDEVRTRSLLNAELKSGLRSIVVPYCDGSVLRLIEIRSMSELRRGRFRILEPESWLCDSDERRVEINDLNVILVPGVAFSRQGDRLGYGAGYYDRLLVSSQNVTKIGLAFECQLVNAIPADPFDVRMDYICTEEETVSCQLSRESG